LAIYMSWRIIEGRGAAMATSTVVPVSEYLSTMYHPDCDYVDGEVQERNLGEQDHSDLQGQLIRLLTEPECKAHFRVNPEIRVQVGASRFRVPDLCLRKVPVQREQIIRTPPLLCIEILSPEDRMTRMRSRIRDYAEMGVLETWIVDPVTRSVTVYAGTSSVEVTSGGLRIPETPVEVKLFDIFKVLDEY
jgi:Uma2 family endonuclease